MELQKRDCEILKLCYEQRFITREHFKTFFNGHHSGHYRRLEELERDGWVKKEYYPIFGRKPILRLSSAGERLVQDKYGISFPPLKGPNLNVLEHDSLVTSVRLRLSELWDATFVPERAIQAQDFPEIPDGIFFFQSGKGIAIEVECSDKGKNRFLTNIERWKGAHSIAFVLYVTPHFGLYRSIIRYLKYSSIDQSLGVVLWEDLQGGTPLVQTKKGEVDLFSKTQLQI